MTALASILTMHSLKKSDNFRYIILGLIVSILIYYFKDLSIALGKTDRIPLIISIWVPIITLFFFNLVGVLQINENKILIFIFSIFFALIFKLRKYI